MKYAIIMMFTYSRAWLAKSREDRRAFNERHILPIFARYAGTVSARFFDAEAFEARFSDFALFETKDLQQYYYLVEELRDSPLFAEELAKINDIVMGIEDGYQQFEATKQEVERRGK